MNLLPSLRVPSRASLIYLLVGQVLLVLSAIVIFGLNWSPTAAAGTSPILIIVNDAAPNPFGPYLAEILRAEGINTYNVVDISLLDEPTITGYKLVILAETTLTAGQATIITDYVNNGGRLVAMRPASNIFPLFDITSATGTLTDGYLKISDTVTMTAGTIPPGTGLVTQTLQIHGTASQYNLGSGAITLAQLYSNISTPTSYPAIAAASNGQAVAFAYDLPHNIIYTRQGNPANGDVDIDGDGVLRTIDLFQGPGNSSWVDRDRIPVPQADEQQRFFARIIQTLINEPLPQLWYFPDQAKTMLILTGDAHANPPGLYQNVLDSVDSYGGDITIYLSIGSPISNAFMQTARGLGHEFGLHPYWNRPDSYPPYNVTNLSEGYTATKTFWNNTGYTSTWSRTVRHHQVHWRGWTDAAAIAVANGMVLDTNFYHWGAWLQKPDTSWPHGYITGSGQPMKFVMADGTILPYYQQLTELVDEQFFASAGGVENLNAPQAIAVSQQLLSASQNGDYAAIMTQFHIDYYGFGAPQDWAEGTMAYAQSNGIPIWNADRWLTFTETRHDAGYNNIVWNNGTGVLTFDLAAAAPVGHNLTTILPLTNGNRTLQTVTVDSNPVSFSTQTIKGVQVAFVNVSAGNHSFQATYQIPVPPTPGPSPTPTNTPTHTPTPTPTNTPTHTLTPTPTNTPDPNGFPTTNVLDNFNRANGVIGSNWNGTTNGYAIASNLLDVGSGSDVYWSATSFGAAQEVFVTLSNIDSSASEIDLLLKGQSATNWSSGIIEVWYDVANHRAQVWTYAPSQGWNQHGADIPITLVNGDQFGAEATANGLVSIYQNGSLMGTRNISTWTFATNGGYIGLWFVNASNSLLEDFGGGGSAPTAINLHSVTSQPRGNWHTNAAATLLVLFGTVTLVSILEYSRRQRA